MIPDEVRNCIAKGESLTVEFKSDKGGFSDDKIAEAVTCLSNGEGGTLIVGVEDDGTITGARPRHGDTTDPLRLQAAISNKTVPPVVTTIELVELSEIPVIVISVPRSATITGTTKGLYVRRALSGDGQPGCVPFLAHEMLAERIQRAETDYALIAEPQATFDDLDPREFDRMRRLASVGMTSVLSTLDDVELGRALNVIEGRDDDPIIRRGALLLFGYPDSIQRFIPTHETAFQVMDNTSVRQNVFAHDPLLKSAEALYEQLQRHNDEEEIDIGLTRVAVPRMAPIAMREIIANALVHRDYTLLGPVAVRLDGVELVVENPGGFPRGVTVKNMLTSSRPRSRTLSEAFYRSGLVERTGRGINRVFESTLRTGRTLPDYSQSDPFNVRVSLPTGSADLSVVKFIVEHDERRGRPFSLAELQVMHALLDGPRVGFQELAEITQLSETATRSTLTRMVEDGVVELRGNGKARRYTLSAAIYRKMASKAGYVRVQEFEPVQQEQMILTYVRAHGSISRREVADLCAVTSEAAKALVHDMRSRGLLQLIGERRGARYIDPNDGTE